MGLSLGASAGGSSDTTKSTSSGNTQKTFTADQSDLQTGLLQKLKDLISGPSSSTVKALQTQSAGEINTEYSTMGDRMNRFLASRGFAQSGQAGQTALKAEMGRQGALAANSAQYGKSGLDLMSQSLAQAMAAAYNNTGTSTSATGQSNEDKSTWGMSAGAGFGK